MSENTTIGTATQTGTRTSKWIRRGGIAVMLGGALTAAVGVALLSVLNVREFTFIDPAGVVGMILIAAGLPAFYASERRWFGRLATVGFGLLTIGWVMAAVSLPIATYGPGVFFLGFLLGLLVALIGALVFGVAVLRTDAETVPRLGAWLLIAALPVGVPLTIGFTQYVIGEFADPWAGPMLLFGLAWVVFGRHLWSVDRTALSSRN